MLFTGDKIDGREAERLGLVLKAVPADALDTEVEAMGLANTQRLATIMDGISRHSPEGVNFKTRSETVGWKQAVDDRDRGTCDWTENRPINKAQ